MDPGWIHRTFSWPEDSGKPLAQWQRELSDAGWELWADGDGVWMTVDNRKVYVVALRRRDGAREEP